MFDLSITKLLVLAVIAVVVFGPDQLPRVASQAARALRDLRRLAEGAREDLREGLGPEFENFDFNDLDPRHFVRKHLIDGINGDEPDTESPIAAVGPPVATLEPGETPPYDAEAT